MGLNEFFFCETIFIIHTNNLLNVINNFVLSVYQPAHKS